MADDDISRHEDADDEDCGEDEEEVDGKVFIAPPPNGVTVGDVEAPVAVEREPECTE